MNHPMVIMVAIGEYDDPEATPNLTAYLQHDVKNVVQLFGDRLNYEVHPSYDLNDGNSIKMQWTKIEIEQLLSQKSNKLTNNIDDYDGLVVVFSGHGEDDNIITSDGQLISEQHIYQYFTISSDNVAVRSIPRLFVFDCCDGQYYSEEIYQRMLKSNARERVNNGKASNVL